jgi:hypothetical protein
MDEELDPKCATALELWRERKVASGTTHEEIDVTKIDYIHRLIRVGELEEAIGKPKAKYMIKPDLSVLLDDASLDIEQAVNASFGIFIGAWKIPVSVFPEAEKFKICHDPFALEDGSPQHPKHAIVVCKKNLAKGKNAVESGCWSVQPKSPSTMDDEERDSDA